MSTANSITSPATLVDEGTDAEGGLTTMVGT